MEPENAAVTRAMVVMPSYSDYVEQLEEKLIMEGSISQQQNPKQNTLKEMQISTQPQSQLVKPVPSSHTIPTQHLNEDVTMCATGSITEELKRYVHMYKASWGYKLASYIRIVIM